jgi:hypothetical protein
MRFLRMVGLILLLGAVVAFVASPITATLTHNSIKAYLFYYHYGASLGDVDSGDP